MMQYNAADSSLHVDIQQTLQLVCSDSVVAFQDSQLSSGDSTQSVSALRAAVATASRAKAAEVERLMAESQKVMHDSVMCLQLAYITSLAALPACLASGFCTQR
jgi:hypothetical protein